MLRSALGSLLTHHLLLPTGIHTQDIEKDKDEYNLAEPLELSLYFCLAGA